MAEQNGLNQQDHDLLRRALKTHEHVTGERASHLADSIAVASPVDPKAKAEASKRAYDSQAKLQNRVEETEQAQRRARVESEGGGPRPAESPNTPANVQPGNPGGGQEAMATERAKAQGFDRKGQEPQSAGGTGGPPPSSQPGGDTGPNAGGSSIT